MLSERQNELKEELEERYRVAEQVEYCDSCHCPDYWIIDTEDNSIADSGGSHNPWLIYQYFIKDKLRESLKETDEPFEDYEIEEDD